MSTVVDYWRMLWQYQVPVVVMLTEEVEKGRVSLVGAKARDSVMVICPPTGVQCLLLAWGHPAAHRLWQAEGGAKCGEELWLLHIQRPWCHQHYSKPQ